MGSNRFNSYNVIDEKTTNASSAMTHLTVAEEIKAIINGISYEDSRRGMPKKAIEIAAKNNIVICYGASDDLMELEGAINDEISANNGISFEDIDNEYSKEIYDFMNVNKIELIWCPDKIKTWGFKVKEGAKFETFNIIEDGEIYCEGIIIKRGETL